MYLVLIDRRIPDIQSIIGSLTENTEYLTFEFRCDVESIKSRITNNYESVAIIQHNYNMDIYRFVLDFSNAILDNLEQEDPELESWIEYIDLLLWLKNERGANYIDLLACDLWLDANWRYMIEKTRSKYDIYIRASLDKTGEGGDFILESDNFDTIGVYFTEQILQYRYYFYGYQTTESMAGYVNYKNYYLPTTNMAKVSSRYSAINAARTSGTTYTDIVSSMSSYGGTMLLRANGSLVLLQSVGGYGFSMPAGVVTSADLVNIKKVAIGMHCYTALKNDGTVICWGSINDGYGNRDINTFVSSLPKTDNNYVISVDAVRSQLVNIVDIYATRYEAFAALSSTGKVVTWGYSIRGAGDPDNAAQAAFKASGVVKIVPGVDSFSMLKSDGTAMVLGGWGNSVIYSTTYFTNSKPIVDLFVCAQSFNTMYLRQNGSTYELVLFHGAIIYTLPQGVTILKFVTHSNQYFDRFFFLLSNNTVVAYQNNSFTLHSNVTDIETTSLAFGMIQNGTVVTSGYAIYGGDVTHQTYGLNTFVGLNLTNPVRLVSTSSAFGVIKSDNKFVWIGSTGAYNSGTFPYSSSTSANSYDITTFNAMSSNVKTVYGLYNTFVIVNNDNKFTVFGYYGASVNITKDANTNVHFEPAYDQFIPYEITYSPSVSPSSIPEETKTTVSYYVSNPDLACCVGRKYQLFNGATLIDTFYPKFNNHTYVFSNVILSTPGTYTMDIKDTTNITYTIESFPLTVFSIFYPCFLQGSKILRMNPETDEEEYITVEKLRRGDLIRTAEHGYKAIELIGYSTIPNPTAASKESRRLYWFRKSKCSAAGLFEDLCVTGDHCILHRTVSDEKKDQLLGYMRDIYVTESHYRVPAFLDDRAEPYARDGPATIWHFALENPNIYHNYGVLANGLLVESCSLHYMYKHSNMKMID